MLRATAGTWCNYATTFAFQILFARAYGSGPEASAFVVVFGMAIAVGGLFTSTAQALAVPRLVGPDGSLSSGALRFLAILIGIAAVFCVALAAASAPIAAVLDSKLGIEAPLVRGLLPLAVAFAFLQLVFGAMGAIALARGKRFVPAVLPGLPTLVGAAWLIVADSPDPRATLLVLVLASVAQVLCMAVVLPRPLRVSAQPLPGISGLAAMTAGSLALLSLLPPIERVLAALDAPSAAAQYDYSMRSLLAVQQLLVGGLVMSSLADWSEGLRNGRFGYLLSSRLVFSALLLALAASFAAGMAPVLVRFVFQHGEFSSEDTDVVARLLRIGLPGFFTGALGLVLSQALLAARRNRTAITIGVLRFLLSLGFVTVFGLLWGVDGVAAGRSVANVVVLVVVMKLVLDIAPLTRSDRDLLYRGTGLVALTGAAAVLMLALPSGAPQLVLTVAVVAALLIPSALLMRSAWHPAV
jgi:putative peptidoglycan lipid II flippase